MCLLFCMSRRMLRKSVKKYIFLISLKKCWGQHFFCRLWANRVAKMRGYPQSPLCISLALAKIFFFHMVVIWRKKPSYLVGTTLQLAQNGKTCLDLARCVMNFRAQVTTNQRHDTDFCKTTSSVWNVWVQSHSSIESTNANTDGFPVY